MAATPNSIITAQSPTIANISLAAVTACTTRAPTATASLAAANIVAFVPTSTNGCRVDSVSFKGCSSSFVAATVAQTITIWEHDGTNAYPIKEIVTTAVTPSTTVASYESGDIPLGIVLPATHSLYVSTSITTTANTTALCGTAKGALL
jgi:hypothetical protein